MKVQLVSPPEEGYVQRNCWLVPLGLLSLATNLKYEIPDVEVEILDGNISNVNKGNDTFNVLSDLERQIDGDVIGFSPSITSYRPALRLAQVTKEKDPRRTIVFGGPHATSIARNILKNREFVDMVVLHDGERPLEYIVKSKLEGRPLEGVPNLFYRDKNGSIRAGSESTITQLLGPGMKFYKLSEIPLPDFSLIDMQPYFTGFAGYRIFSTYAQHGCLFRSRMKENACIHCSRSDPVYRVLNPKRFAKHIRELQDRYGAQLIHDVSDDFTGSKHWVKEFHDAYISEDLKVGLLHFARADEIDEEMMDYLNAIRTRQVFIGFETGNEELLKTNQKRYTKEHMRNAVKLLGRNGIRVQGSWIFGYPGETVQSMEDTLAFAEELGTYAKDSNYIISFSVMTPLPPSPGWDMFMRDPVIRQKYQHRDNYDATELQRDFVTRFCNVDYDTIMRYAQKLLLIAPYTNLDFEQAQCPLLKGNSTS